MDYFASVTIKQCHNHNSHSLSLSHTYMHINMYTILYNPSPISFFFPPFFFIFFLFIFKKAIKFLEEISEEDFPMSKYHLVFVDEASAPIMTYSGLTIARLALLPHIGINIQSYNHTFIHSYIHTFMHG